MLKDIKKLESVQRRASKYILNDYASDYRSRLLELELLPLMMYLELNDIMFYVSAIKSPPPNFDITHYIEQSASCTRSARSKLKHVSSATNKSKNFYFRRFPRLWNSLPIIDTTRSYKWIKTKLYMFLFNHFISNFDPANPCTYHYCCPCYSCSCTPLSPHFYSLEDVGTASSPSDR